MDEKQRAVDLIRRINRFLRAGDLGDVMVGELTLAQIRVLFRLRNRGDMTSGQLATGLGVTLPTVTSVIDRLVRQELVERRDDPSDRRRVIVALTPSASALVERIQQGRRTRLARAIDTLAPAVLAELNRGLAALATAADAIERAEAPDPINANPEVG